MNPLRTWFRFVLGSSTVCGETRQKWLQQYVTSQGIYARNSIKAFLIKEQLTHSYTYLALFVIYIDIKMKFCSSQRGSVLHEKDCRIIQTKICSDKGCEELIPAPNSGLGTSD